LNNPRSISLLGVTKSVKWEVGKGIRDLGETRERRDRWRRLSIPLELKEAF